MIQTETDLVTLYPYAAGLYEGEGTITILHQKVGPRRPRNYFYLNMAVSGTDPEPLQLFRAIVQVGKVYGPYSYKNTKYKDAYRWQVNTFESSQHVICCLWPWLSRRRKDQIRHALERHHGQY